MTSARSLSSPTKEFRSVASPLKGFPPPQGTVARMIFSESESLALMPLIDARALLGEGRVRLRMLLPPYAAVGLGVLRVLRARERDGAMEIVAGYDGYARLADVMREQRA